MTPIPDLGPRPPRPIACLLTGRGEDVLALAEALRRRGALVARLLVLYALPALVCIVSPERGVWCHDPTAVQDGAAGWLEGQTAGLPVEEPALLPGFAAASVGHWIERARSLLLVAARRHGRLGRLFGGDAAVHLPRHAGVR